MSNTFIVYVSDKSDIEDKFTVRDIAIESSRNNQLKGISGILMGVGKHFLQVLEGEDEVLDPLLDKIRRDPRHTNLQILYRGKMEDRVFGRWSMGCVTCGNESTNGSQHFDDIANEIERLCQEDFQDARESLKDLLIEIPKRFANQEVAIS